MKILIDGGAGFIGSQLGYRLHKQGHQVILLDNLSYGYKENLIINNETFGEFILDDIRNPEFIKHLTNVDVVIHLAGVAALPVNQSDPLLAYSVNVAGFGNVLEACRRAKTPKIIFASTSAVYENNTNYPFNESDPVSPSLTYSMTKKHAEDLAHAYTKNYGMDITILRFFNVYGPHHDFKRKTPPLIAYIIKCLMLNEIPVLHSDGNQKRDYVYVDDICSMCELVMTHPNAKNETFNIASNTVISMSEIYDKISNIMKSNIKPIFRDPSLLWDKYSELSEGFPLHKDVVIKETNKFSKGSFAKAEKLLGWHPQTSFDNGISETVNYALRTGL